MYLILLALACGLLQLGHPASAEPRMRTRTAHPEGPGTRPVPPSIGEAPAQGTPPQLRPTTPSAEADSARPPVNVADPARPPAARRLPLVAVIEYRRGIREHDYFSRAMPQLLAFVRESTKIAAPLRAEVVPLFDDRVQRAMMLYMTGQDAHLRLGTMEKRALGTYLREHGLLFAEDVISGGSRDEPPAGGGVTGTPFDRQLKSLIADPLVLGTAGKRWYRVPADHPLYSNYFTFPDGPPLAASSAGNVATLEMLEYRGRIAVLFSDLNLSWFWATEDAEGRDRPLQLGANILVQALAQAYAGRPLPVDP